ncbi:MAG: hypothetical protein JW715_05170 [Sedimentisphaerales bacterium]|nr:hypothetical protein [Sedimentisphaerales bacterium]
MNEREKNFKKHERGSIVGLVLVIGVCLAIIGWGMLRMGFGSRVISSQNNSIVVAREAADAGLTEALHLLNQKLLAWPIDFSSLPSAMDVPLNPSSSQPTYSYEVVPNDTTNPVYYNGYTIHSTGYYRDQVKKVHAMTTLKSIWDNQFYGRVSIELGSYTEHGVVPEGSSIVFQIRTDSDEPGAIKLHPNLVFNGEIVVGPGSDPESVISQKKSSIINGPTYAASEYMEFPFKTVPEVIDSTLPPSSGGITTIPAGTYGFPSITIGNGEKLYIDGEVTISTGNVNIKNGGEIRVLEGGSLELYADGNFIAGNGSYIYNDAMDATKLKVYGSENCTKVEIKNSGDFRGAIYAPNASLEIKNSGAVYGSFIGSTIDVKNSGQLFFDASLSNPVEDPSYFAIERWWEEAI